MAASRARFQSLGSTEDEVHFRITVFGDVGVGKSSIISQFLHQKYSPDYKETIEDLYRTHLNIEGTHVTLDILDTAGHGEFIAMRELAIGTSDAFILVFSKVDMHSFETVERLRADIIAKRGNVPIAIVENKSDIPAKGKCTDTTATKILDAVVCIDWESTFVQTSAKDDVNINLVFEQVLCLSEKINKRKKRTGATRRRILSDTGKPDERRNERCNVS